MRQSSRTGLLLTISVIFLSACYLKVPPAKQPQGTVVDSPPPEITSQCGDLLAYALWLQQNTPTGKQLKTVLAQLQQSKNTCARLQRAIMLAAPETEIQNDHAALNILKEIAADIELTDKEIQLRQFLQAHIAQRQHLRELLGGQEKQLKQRKTQNTVLRNKIKMLESQIEQLKNLETEIDKKERSVSSPVDQ